MKKIKLIIIMLIVISGCRAQNSNEKSNTFTSTLKEIKIEQGGADIKLDQLSLEV